MKHSNTIETEINLAEFWQIVKKYRFLIISITIFSTLLSFIYISMFVTPIFKGSVLIEVANYIDYDEGSSQNSNRYVFNVHTISKKAEFLYYPKISSVNSYDNIEGVFQLHSISSSKDIIIKNLEEVVEAIIKDHKTKLEKITLSHEKKYEHLTKGMEKINSDYLIGFKSMDLCNAYDKLEMAKRVKNTTQVGAVTVDDSPINYNKKVFITATLVLSLFLSVILAFIINFVKKDD